MKWNNAMKVLALIGLVSFTVNAKQTPVAAGKSISAAITAAAAKDTITLAAGAYTDHFVVNKQLTIIGAGKTKTTISRAKTDDSVATITITAKNVTISNMTICGHDAAPGADTADTMKSTPTSNAINIASCIVVGGSGMYRRDLAAARGGNGILIQKHSKYVFLKDDSLKGGMANQTRWLRDTIINITEDGSGVSTGLYIVGKAGAGLLVDSSSYVNLENCICEGGDGNGLNWEGRNAQGSPGIVCYFAKWTMAKSTVITGGATIYMYRDTVEAFYLYDSSSLDTSNVTLNSQFGGRVDENGSYVGSSSSGVFNYGALAADKRDVFALRKNANQLLSLACFLKKESFVAIDLLNARGQAVKRLRMENAAPGMHQYALDMKGLKGSNSIYLVKVSTRENSGCFRLVSVR
jgi:hypothetical protein